MAKGNFGERLKREREMREVSLTEVTQATRIGPRYLEALENEQWEKLPGGAFNRGFVRAVARYLGLDEENLLAEYDLARSQDSAKSPAPRPAENRIPQPSKWPMVLTALILLLVVAALAVAGVYGWRRIRRGKQSPAAATVHPHLAAPLPIPAAEAASLSPVSAFHS